MAIDHGDVIARSTDIQSGEVIRKIVFKTSNASLSSLLFEIFREGGRFFFSFSDRSSVLKKNGDWMSSFGKFDTEKNCRIRIVSWNIYIYINIRYKGVIFFSQLFVLFLFKNTRIK